MDYILQLGTKIFGSSLKTLLCIGKLMAHKLFLNWVRNYSSQLQNVVQMSLEAIGAEENLLFMWKLPFITICRAPFTSDQICKRRPIFLGIKFLYSGHLLLNLKNCREAWRQKFLGCRKMLFMCSQKVKNNFLPEEKLFLHRSTHKWTAFCNWALKFVSQV